MSKQSLLTHLITSGKTTSWNNLATIHKISSGESARSIWKRYRFNEVKGNSIISQLPRDNEKIRLEKLEELIERKQIPLIKKIDSSIKERLLEISFPDLHIGKLSHYEETGEDYDINIAVKRCKDAVQSLLSEIDKSKIDRILLPLGNDFLTVDNEKGTTTMGTPQSIDTRFNKMFRVAKELVIDVIEELSVYAPVDVLIVPGNHDLTTMYTLGEVLCAWYKDDTNVTINNSAKLRKYYKYGQNMIMLTHGDKERHSELGLIAAHEQAEMWGSTKYREVQLGHFHKNKSVHYTMGDEYPGFKIRILPSLSGTDAWHYAQGYLSSKSAKAFIFDKNKGLITEYTHNL